MVIVSLRSCWPSRVRSEYWRNTVAVAADPLTFDPRVGQVHVNRTGVAEVCLDGDLLIPTKPGPDGFERPDIALLERGCVALQSRCHRVVRRRR